MLWTRNAGQGEFLFGFFGIPGMGIGRFGQSHRLVERRSFRHIPAVLRHRESAFRGGVTASQADRIQAARNACNMPSPKRLRT